MISVDGAKGYVVKEKSPKKIFLPKENLLGAREIPLQLSYLVYVALF